MSDRVLVKFRAGVAEAARALTAQGAGGAVLSRPSYADFEIVKVPDGTDPIDVAARLRARGDVIYAELAYRVHALSRPNDEFFHLQWNLSAIDMERAWDINPGATSDIIVAVLDSGVAFSNAMVRYNVVVLPDGRVSDVTTEVPFAAAPELGELSRFVAPHDFVWDDDLPFDLDGHGTHVSGTIGQLTNNSVGVAGMAYNVRLMPLKVIAGEWDFIFGAPNAGTTDVVARAIRYAVDNGARIINMSIGFEAPEPSRVIEDALRYAVSRGAFVAIAAGNSFLEGNPTIQPAALAATISGVMSVAAVGRGLERSAFSSTGPSVEIAAPGGDQARGGTQAGVLQQTLDADLAQVFPPRFDAFVYEFFEGTSMAAPHVSGFAALLMQQGITTPAAIEAAIRTFATDRGAIGRDDEYGYGLIDPRATLRGLGLIR